MNINSVQSFRWISFSYFTDFVFLLYRFRFISLDFVFLLYRFRWILFSFRFVSFLFVSQFTGTQIIYVPATGSCLVRLDVKEIMMASSTVVKIAPAKRALIQLFQVKENIRYTHIVFYWNIERRHFIKFNSIDFSRAPFPSQCQITNYVTHTNCRFNNVCLQF